MSTMTVSTFLKVSPLLPAATSILLRGNHGIGKSQLGRQLARLIKARENITSGFPVIDRRLSQCSEGDIIGLPSTDGEVTRFNPPDWYKKACTEPCLLFLDELNRATPEVMQAGFQIVLDRELNGWKLHPQTRVMSAVNSAAAYNVNEMDPALLDRFWVIDLTPDSEDWIAWAKGENMSDDPQVKATKALFDNRNCLPLVVDFMVEGGNADKWLDPPKAQEPGRVYASRRSWERLGDALAEAGIAADPEHELFYPICVGYVGVEAAIKMTDFAKNNDVRFTGADILDRYSKVRKKITSKKKAEIFNEAISKVTDHVIKLGKITEAQGKNMESFMNDLPQELRISFWSKIATAGADNIDLTKTVHKYLVKGLLNVFGVEEGAAGMGVIPNIPALLSDDKNKK